MYILRFRDYIALNPAGYPFKLYVSPFLYHVTAFDNEIITADMFIFCTGTA